MPIVGVTDGVARAAGMAGIMAASMDMDRCIAVRAMIAVIIAGTTVIIAAE